MTITEPLRPWWHGRRWTNEDDQWLLDRVSATDKSNMDLIREVAKMAGRSEKAIRLRIQKLDRLWPEHLKGNR